MSFKVLYNSFVSAYESLDRKGTSTHPGFINVYLDKAVAPNSVNARLDEGSRFMLEATLTGTE
jgi:hypothetical protein